MTDRIETPRLVLRKARESDLDSIWRNVWCDDRLAATMLWRTTKTREEALERMKRTIKFQADSYSYFVCLRENDEPIGFGGIREISPGLYDETGIRERARALNRAFSWCGDFKEYFAVKALPNPHILKIFKEEGIGADCASECELMLAEMASFSAAPDRCL